MGGIDGLNPKVWDDPRLQDRSKREQGFEPGSYFVEHLCRSSAYETRSAVLPGDASQLIGLDNAADLAAVRQRDVKAPITIPPRYRTGNAPAGQLIEGKGRKDKRRSSSGLLVSDGLKEIQPNNVTRIRAVGRHLTTPHCRA
jgi:hypothetical protein